MKHKLILFLFIFTTCLSPLNEATSVSYSANNKLDLWTPQAETGPTAVAWCENCGQPGQPGSTDNSGGVSINGNSRGGG